MAKWSIRDLWGRLTQKKTLNPEMRTMLMSLDGVYEPQASASDDRQTPAQTQREDGSQHAAR
jgi:hypothetical protein